ncbi:MAG: iron uptake porin [Aphanocapsa sp. GSE-SYN-MK-11-07L]|jgi:hypothetical protein|nr:iron uptake porin [Aphanocapsa sp. GSE-SYN-MK-11-07L]
MILFTDLAGATQVSPQEVRIDHSPGLSFSLPSPRNFEVAQAQNATPRPIGNLPLVSELSVPKTLPISNSIYRPPQNDIPESFQPTSKLEGEVIFTGVGIGGEIKTGNQPRQNHLTVGSRVRLNFDTSFRGEDRLRVRLQSVNTPKLEEATGTDMARLAFQGDSQNQFELSRLEYVLPVNKQATLYVEAIGGSLNDFADTLNPLLTGSGAGSISRFGQRNPIFRQGGGTGIGLEYEFNPVLRLTVGYLADGAEDPNQGFLGQESYAAIGQLTFKLKPDIKLGATYVYSYNGLDTGTGSQLANDPFAEQSAAISAHSLGFQSTIRLNRMITLGGWLGFTQADAIDLPNQPTAKIINWATTLAFADLGGEGNLLGFVVGQPPKVFANDYEGGGERTIDPNTSLHLEAFYRYQVTDNIAITSGLMMIVNPEQNSSNQPIYVGVMRTTFSF